jgi:CheY-like chemotaxis protein
MTPEVTQKPTTLSLDGMGTLVGAVAHDFNNILNVIQGYASLIALHADNNAEIGVSLGVINDAIKRGAELVQQLLTMARNGEVDLQPEDLNSLLMGRGSSFRLPVAIAPAEAASDRGNGAARNGDANYVSADRNATALVVEDEEAMLHLLRNILVDRGYRVFTAIDGEEAATRYHRNGDDIDVVLLDLDLPKSSGTEVLRKIRNRNPNARVLVTSGYLDPELKAALAQDGVTRFIHKPYGAEEIIAALEAEEAQRAANSAEENIR